MKHKKFQMNNEIKFWGKCCESNASKDTRNGLGLQTIQFVQKRIACVQFLTAVLLRRELNYIRDNQK